MEKDSPSKMKESKDVLIGLVNDQTIESQDTIDKSASEEKKNTTIDVDKKSAVDVNEASIVIEDERKDQEDDESSFASPAPAGSEKASANVDKKKIKQAANAESPALKSQEIFGAVKVKDGLFLGDQYSAQVSIPYMPIQSLS